MYRFCVFLIIIILLCIFDTAHAHIFDFLILNLERFIFYIYLFAEDVQLICTKRANIDNNNLKMNFGNFLYIQPENIKRNIRNIETTETKLANAKIAVILIYIYINVVIGSMQTHSNKKSVEQVLLLFNGFFINIYIYIYVAIMIYIKGT